MSIIRHLVNRVPFIGTGYIQFDEFCSIVRKKMQDDEDERELREMFRILDKEKKGEVNTNELRHSADISKLRILQYLACRSVRCFIYSQFPEWLSNAVMRS